MIDPALATAADYADALLVARRTKNLVALVLLILLLAQLGLFLSLKYAVGPDGLTKLAPVPAVVIPPVVSPPVVSPTVTPTTTDADGIPAAASPVVSTPASTLVTTASPSAVAAPSAVDLIKLGMSVSMFGGLVLSILLVLVLILIAHIMLVGRLIGVSPVISSLVVALFLALLLFPWQSLLVTSRIDSGGMDNANFVPPGILYSWSELAARVHSTPADVSGQVLYWARFVAAPVLAMILVLRVQIRSGRGLRQALGEDVSPDNPKFIN